MVLELAFVKFLVKVFKRLYLLNLWMEVDHTCPDVRYWSEIVCCTIPMHSGQGHRLRKKLYMYSKCLVKVFRSLYLLKFEPDMT